MIYKLQITRFVKNDNFEQQDKEYKDRLRYGSFGPGAITEYPTKFVEEVQLLVELNDEQYQAVKKAVLETFK